MDRAGWCYVCGLVSAQWERLLRGRQVLALLEADSAEEVATRLRASLLFAERPPGQSPVQEVPERFAKVVQYVALLSPDPRIGDLFLQGRRWEEFRRFAKEAVSETARPRGPRQEPERRPTSVYEACWSGEVEDERLRPFADAARTIRSELPAEGDRPGWIDRYLDACEAASLMRSAAALESEDLARWVRTWLDLRAALGLVRARRSGWDTAGVLGFWRRAGFDEPGLAELAAAREEDWPRLMRELGLPQAEGVAPGPDFPARVERYIDERVAELASAASGMPFGPERVFAFLWALRCEAVNLRLVLTAAGYGIPPEAVREEVREGYG